MNQTFKNKEELVTSTGMDSIHTTLINTPEEALDYENFKKTTAIWSSVINILLGTLKLVVGIISGSISIISEAAHSGVDLIASLIAYYAVKSAEKPSDSHHAYGHGKVENLSGAFEAFLVVVAALWIVYESFHKFQSNQPPEFLEYGIVVMIISTISNYWITRKLYKVAKLTNSHALKADALHHEADVWTSIGILIGLILIKITGIVWLDPLIAIIMAGIIFKAGYDMTIENIHQLNDIRLPLEEEEAIKELIIKNQAVIKCVKLRTRRSGSRRLIDTVLILNKDMHLDKAHAVCDAIEESITEKFEFCDVVIHLEPHDANSLVKSKDVV